MGNTNSVAKSTNPKNFTAGIYKSGTIFAEAMGQVHLAHHHVAKDDADADPDRGGGTRIRIQTDIKEYMW